jgi:hypothetical protein
LQCNCPADLTWRTLADGTLQLTIKGYHTRYPMTMAQAADFMARCRRAWVWTQPVLEPLLEAKEFLAHLGQPVQCPNCGQYIEALREHRTDYVAILEGHFQANPQCRTLCYQLVDDRYPNLVYADHAA